MECFVASNVRCTGSSLWSKISALFLVRVQHAALEYFFLNNKTYKTIILHLYEFFQLSSKKSVCPLNFSIIIKQSSESFQYT